MSGAPSPGLLAADRPPHKGTLFLDEIGELPLELQPKLLRALQEQEFEKLGSSQTVRVDVRIVAATNQDLEQMVSERRFRADLYYRLSVFPIPVPPLRERIEDIPVLIRHFVREFARRMNKTIDGVPQDVIDALRRHDWPGNIRAELYRAGGAVYRRPAVESAASGAQAFRRGAFTSPPLTLSEMERVHIRETLEETSWVIGGRAGAAARLGLPRTTVIARMQRFGISRDTPGSRVPRLVIPVAEHMHPEVSRPALAHAAGM